jgi:hypothetical protein
MCTCVRGIDCTSTSTSFLVVLTIGVEVEVQSMPLTPVHMTVHSPIALYGHLNKKGADLNRVYSVSTVCVNFVLCVKYICCSLYRCCLCILLVL